jgi:hypothetical protein
VALPRDEQEPPVSPEPPVIRRLISVVVGLVVAGATFAACSGLDPNPPHPGAQPDPGVEPDRLIDLPDGSPDGDPPDTSRDAP